MQITIESLQKHRPCDPAEAFVAKLLPVTIYEEVERNTEVAKKAIVYYIENMCCCESCLERPVGDRWGRSLASDLRWLMSVTLLNIRDNDITSRLEYNAIYDEIASLDRLKEENVALVARALAWVAKVGSGVE